MWDIIIPSSLSAFLGYVYTRKISTVKAIESAKHYPAHQANFDSGNYVFVEGVVGAASDKLPIDCMAKDVKAVLYEMHVARHFSRWSSLLQSWYAVIDVFLGFPPA